MKKRIIAIILIVTVCISLNSCFVAFANDLNTEETVQYQSIYNKLHFYFGNAKHETIDSYKELSEATSLAVNYISNYNLTYRTNESVSITVEFKSGFMDTDAYKQFAEERASLNSVEDIRDFRGRLNEFSRLYHTKIVESNTGHLSKISYTNIDHIDYSPFVVLTTSVQELSADSLVSLARYDDVMNISVYHESEPESTPFLTEEELSDNSSSDPNTWTNGLKSMNAYDVVYNGTYTGEGVRVGILEATSVCDVTHPNLVGKSVTVREGYSTNTHATAVTSIIALMAPDAEIFCSPDLGGEALEWFIDNQCDVVNYSGGFDSPGYYSYLHDAVFDYQINAHFITFVKSAGNNGEGDHKITSPGYAFNAITVGGSTINALGQITHHSMSSYLSSYPRIKPNIVAPFKIVDIPNIGHEGGTSISAPLVTGCIALLMENDSSYKVYPESTQALMALTASKTYDFDQYTSEYGFFDYQVGAGIINLEAMLENAVGTYVYNNSNTTIGAEITSLTVHLNAGDKIRIGLSWSVDTNSVSTQGAGGYNATTVYLNDYNLLLYNPDDVLVSASTLTDSNIELIRHTASESGIYRMVVVQASNMPGYYISLLYNVNQ